MSQLEESHCSAKNNPLVQDDFVAAEELMSDKKPANLPEIEVNESDNHATNYILGLRLRVISTALCLCLFLSTLEVTIVSTSIVGITNHLDGFSKSSWIVTAYLVTYIGFAIILVKLSDIFGRKLLICSSLFMFVVFSGACGASSTITQLIVLRAFQGIGGSGIYAIALAMFFELVPPSKYPKYSSGASAVVAISLLLGPILGGVMNESSSSWIWRWIFLLNVPAGILGLVALFMALPTHFPHHGLASHKNITFGDTFSSSSFRKVDTLGAALLLTATIFLITALEEAGVAYQWKSGLVITLLVLSGLLWTLFFIWEYSITPSGNRRQPVFPWRFMQSRVWVGMMLNALFLGPPFTVGIFQIAQRFQVVNSLSSLEAGIRLLPFSFVSPIGGVAAGILAGKALIPPIYVVLFASSLQVIGFALLSTIPVETEIITAQYGYQTIAGFGVGININTLLLITPFCVEKRDRAVAIGTIAQFRSIGGSLGLAIVANVLNGYVSPRLSKILSPEQVDAVLETSAAIATLPTSLQEPIRLIFAAGYNLQLKVVAAFAAAQIPATLLIWKKKQIGVS